MLHKLTPIFPFLSSLAALLYHLHFSCFLEFCFHRETKLKGLDELALFVCDKSDRGEEFNGDRRSLSPISVPGDDDEDNGANQTIVLLTRKKSSRTVKRKSVLT